MVVCRCGVVELVGDLGEYRQESFGRVSMGLTSSRREHDAVGASVGWVGKSTDVTTTFEALDVAGHGCGGARRSSARASRKAHELEEPVATSVPSWPAASGPASSRRLVSESAAGRVLAGHLKEAVVVAEHFGHGAG